MWAEITAVGTAGTPTFYTWKKKVPDSTGVLVDASPSVTGTYAYDVNNANSVRPGDVVWLRSEGLDESENTVYSFESLPCMQFAKVVAMYDEDGNSWTNFPTDYEYPTYCTAKSCDSAGNNVNATVDVWVNLNTKSDSPLGIITAADQIIAYVLGDGQNVLTDPNPDVTISGQAVVGRGCWLDWPRFRTDT
jgi:hypothetical protein